MSTSAHGPDTLDIHVLSVALIGPEEQRRNAVASALAGSQASVTREFSSYPELDDVPQLLETDYDVIIVDLDSNPEHALDLVEHICGNSSVTVMVYSAQADPEMLVRCMRAGAREFLTQPIAPQHDRGSPGSRFGSPPDGPGYQESAGQVVGLRRRQGRLWSHHHREQLCHPAGAGVRARTPC